MINGNMYLILLSVALPTVLSQTDYCSTDLCGPYKHVACNNTGMFSSTCQPDVRIIPITPSLRQYILNNHNALRNLIAGGFNKFEPAERMATMIWDEELSKLATYNVKKCEESYDCHNTKLFRYSGQNSCMSYLNNIAPSIPKVINTGIIGLWFNEYVHCSMDIINEFSLYYKGVSHFTTMVQEKATHVGCAILKQVYPNGLYVDQLMTCYYSYTNIVGEPVYRAGPAASKCKTGVNKKYKYLCSPKEIYDVNSPSKSVCKGKWYMSNIAMYCMFKQ